MPKYNYHCDDCDEYFEIRHSITKLLESCDKCDSKEFFRVPYMTTIINKTSQKKKNETKTGTLVEEYIKINKEEVKEEKLRFKEREMK